MYCTFVNEIIYTILRRMVKFTCIGKCPKHWKDNYNRAPTCVEKVKIFYIDEYNFHKCRRAVTKRHRKKDRFM